MQGMELLTTTLKVALIQIIITTKGKDRTTQGQMLTLTSMVIITSNRVMTMVAREQHHLMPATVVTLVATVGTLRKMIALLIKVLKLAHHGITIFMNIILDQTMETRISINSLLPRTHNIMEQVALNLSLKLRIPILPQLLTISSTRRLELTMNTTISSIMLELELDKQHIHITNHISLQG
jgi:hypothetical protein